jgi:hypothetical protein
VSFDARPERDGDAVVRGLVLAACLSAILGAKIWLIAGYGSNVPFWDQWEEPVELYRPLLNGTLRLADLFAAHNEHRTLLTRLIHLGLFKAEGRWEPIGQALVNAAVHASAIVLLVAMLGRPLRLVDMFLLAVFGTFLFAIPFGWGNTLVGSQVAFYLLILLAPLSLWLLYASAAWTLRWWLGTLLAVLSYFSVASGALSLPAFIAVAALQFACGQRRGRSEWFGLLTHLVLAAAIMFDIPSVSGHAGLAPTSLRGWYEAAGIALSWPISKPGWSPLLQILTSVALYAPPLVLALRLMKEGASIRDSRWLQVAVAGWTLLQVLALISARGLNPLETRYYDILLLTPLASASALLSLQDDRLARGPSRTITGLACAWFIAIVLGAGHKALSNLPGELGQWRQLSEVRAQNLNRFLTTGDFSAIANKPEFHIPYPSAERLRDIVDDPIIRLVLPAGLSGQPERAKGLKTFTLRQGPLLLPVGFALFIAAALFWSHRPPSRRSHGEGRE